MDRYVEGYIDQTRVIRARLLDIVADYKRASEEKLRLFLDPLEMWVYELFRRPLPHDWRDRLADFLAYWEQDQGYTLTPESTRILYAAIEMLAKRRGLLPAGAESIARSQPCARPSVVKAPVAIQRPSEPVVAPAKSPPPSDWPKTSPQQRAQDRANAELAGWQQSLPAYPEDPKWEHRFEIYGRIARDRLLKLFQELAVEGRMARDIGDPKRADLEPLFVQQQWVEQAYFGYLQARIDIYLEWTRYLRLGRFAIGVSILALLEKIERELPARIEGIGSPRDSSLSKARQESFEAFAKAQAGLERADAALVWTDRAIVPVVSLAGAVRQAAQQACAAALAEGISPTAAHKIGLAAAMSQAAGASDSLVVVGDLIPPALQDARLDEREIRAGLAVFLTIATLRYVASLCELAPSPELPYNGARNQAAPASPKSIALAAADAEKKQPAGNGPPNAVGPGGLVYPRDINDPYGLAGALLDRFVTGKGPTSFVSTAFDKVPKFQDQVVRGQRIKLDGIAAQIAKAAQAGRESSGYRRIEVCDTADVALFGDTSSFGAWLLGYTINGPHSLNVLHTVNIRWSGFGVQWDSRSKYLWSDRLDWRSWEEAKKDAEQMASWSGIFAAMLEEFMREVSVVAGHTDFDFLIEYNRTDYKRFRLDQ